MSKLQSGAIIYRPGSHADIPAMALIRAAEWETEDYWRKRIAEYMDRQAHAQKALLPRIYVAVEDSYVVGFSAGHLTRRFDCDGELQWINVVKGRRGSGIASQLTRLLAAWFVENGAKRICIDPDDTSRKFYESLGVVPLNAHWMVWEDISILLK
jgi:GNAT superfamily N-acetyltransferase